MEGEPFSEVRAFMRTLNWLFVPLRWPQWRNQRIKGQGGAHGRTGLTDEPGLIFDLTGYVNTKNSLTKERDGGADKQLRSGSKEQRDGGVLAEAQQQAAGLMAVMQPQKQEQIHLSSWTLMQRVPVSAH